MLKGKEEKAEETGRSEKNKMSIKKIINLVMILLVILAKPSGN
jgi:hypothetical protein